MLDRGTVREIMREVEEAARTIAARHGLEFHRQSAKFASYEMTSRLTLRVAGAAEREAETQRDLAPFVAARLGLPQDIVGKSFNHKGYRFTVTGLKPERPRYPVSCTRADGRSFKFPALVVKNKLEAEAGERLSSGIPPEGFSLAGRNAFNRLG